MDRDAVTAGEVLRAMAKEIYPPDDPEAIFVEWMISSMPDLRGAAAQLGIEVAEGPNFAKRLKEAVLPKLLEQQKGQVEP